jgi:nucleoside-diphosphate-sugar epimerase
MDAPVLVFGASGPIGRFLLPRLAECGGLVMAVSRHQPEQADPGTIWIQHDLDCGPLASEANVLIGLGPLRHVLEQVCHGRRLGRVIAMSSASTLFKTRSSDPDERHLMAELVELEQQLEEACEQREIKLTLLKPTLIYAPGLDANLTRVAGLIGRLGLAPYCGRGLRQPVHADDLARLIVECLLPTRESGGRWLLGGGETLAYPDLLRRLAERQGRAVRLLPVPLWPMKLVLGLAHALGRLRDIRTVMLERQRIDLLVDDAPAREKLGWNPRPFRP